MVSVLMTCTRLVGLKSPVPELTVTLFKFKFARTDVKRTSQSLSLPSIQLRQAVNKDSPLILDHFQKMAMIDNAFEDGSES
jgi:hypothetical protein